MAISKPWRETPLIESTSLSNAAKCRIHLKLENLQPSGSFKSRAVGNFMLCRLREHKNHDQPIHFYSSSGGNAGLAATHAAKLFGKPCTVVCPLSTKPSMISRIRAAGATDVRQIGASWRDADTYLRAELLGKDPGGVYVPPFDHPDVWAGNSTMIRECYAQWYGDGAGGADGSDGRTSVEQRRKSPAAVVCSVGGGGLFCGIVQGLRDVGWGSVPVVAVETSGADSLAHSLQQDEMVTLDAITSQARSLGATRVAERAFELAQAGVKEGTVKSVVCSDTDAMSGCLRLAEDERMIVEMACGVCVEVVYPRGDGGGESMLEQALGRKLDSEDEIIVVVCGGSDVGLETLQKWREDVADPRLEDGAAGKKERPAADGRA